ncbi:sigma-70 family RNA polymerase sigma factor [Caldalkalibacillus mannanilyticus]|uniref:sigma-70 family RNA polymerase sigma factor n=1 Tax=Caldalkalibacillus mannanilyticus TaxID=1418 RepID=UPI000468EF5F|nr:sigma-70 family RNA polymerase sigma factor [Caldalkalibacillus mannanilyticus]
MNPILRKQSVSIDFEQYIQPHYTTLKFYCFSITQSKWDAEDLLQTTLMKLYSTFQKKGSLTSASALSKSYLYRIAKNSWIDQIRKEKNISYLEWDEGLADLKEKEEYELMAGIDLLAQTLTEKQTICYLLTYYFQYTAPDISNLAGLTEGAIKALLHRAKEKLKQTCEVLEKGQEVTRREENNEKDIERVSLYLRAIQEQNPDLLLVMIQRLQNTRDTTAEFVPTTLFTRRKLDSSYPKSVRLTKGMMQAVA